MPSGPTLAEVSQLVDHPIPSGPLVSRPEIDSAYVRLKLSDRLPVVGTESSVAEARKGARGFSALLACCTAKPHRLCTFVTFSPSVPRYAASLSNNWTYPPEVVPSCVWRLAEMTDHAALSMLAGWAEASRDGQFAAVVLSAVSVLSENVTGVPALQVLSDETSESFQPT